MPARKGLIRMSCLSELSLLPSVAVMLMLRMPWSGEAAVVIVVMGQLGPSMISWSEEPNMR